MSKPRSLLARWLDAVLALLGARTGLLALFDNTKGDFVAAAVKGLPIELGNRIPAPFEEWPTPSGARSANKPTGTTLEAPLVYAGVLVGVVRISNPLGRRQFAAGDRQLLSLAAAQAAAAIHSGRLRHHSLRSHDQTAELNRTRVMHNSLASLAIQLEATSTPDAVMTTLGEELWRLKLNCLIADLALKDNAFDVLYVSPGISGEPAADEQPIRHLRGARLELGRFRMLRELVEHEWPAVIRNPASLITRIVKDDKTRQDELPVPDMPRDMLGLALPLVQNQCVGGILLVWGEDLQESDLPGLRVLASQVASALDRTRSLQAEIRAHRVVAYLHSAVDQLSQARDLEGIIERLFSALHPLIPYKSISVWLLEAGGKLVLAGQRGYEQGPKKVAGRPLSLNRRSALPSLLSKGTSILGSDGGEVEAWNPLLEGNPVNSWLSVPLSVGGRVIGLYTMESTKRKAFTDEHRRLAETVAPNVAIMIENARLIENLRASREQLRQLAGQVVSAQEEERKRVSRELHDETAQSLTVLTMDLAGLHEDMGGQSAELVERVKKTIAMTREMVQKMNQLARQLRPVALDTLGLNTALEMLCKEYEQRSMFKVKYTGTEVQDVTDAQNITLYRFAQEALTNAAKHAAATRVTVTLKQNTRETILLVQDNGKGFEPEAISQPPPTDVRLGLLGMKERLEIVHGRLLIETAPGKGTLLAAHVPRERAKQGANGPKPGKHAAKEARAKE